MLAQADFAFLIMSAEDEQATGKFNPRLNVVHEAGLFQGRLGFQKAILVLEERDVERFQTFAGSLTFRSLGEDRKRNSMRRREGIVMQRRACGPTGGPIAKRMQKINYAGYRFPPEIIQQSIWLYLRFTLSLRDVEDLLAERGVAVSCRDHSALGEPFRTDDRGRPAKASSEASCDLASRRGLSENRRPHGVYLWRAVDAEGEVLDVLVQSKRNKHAALRN